MANGRRVLCMAGVLLASVPLIRLSLAAEPALGPDDYLLTIKNHRFTPETLEIPTDRKVRIVIRNLDATVEEFESKELDLQKIIVGGRTAILSVGPFKPGTYRFIGEFYPDTANGWIVVK